MTCWYAEVDGHLMTCWYAEVYGYLTTCCYAEVDGYLMTCWYAEFYEYLTTCWYAAVDGYLNKISAILRLFILFVLTVSQKEYYYIPYENNFALEVK